MPDLETSGGVIRGQFRCSAIGLERGDCQMRRLHDSAYCYYHDKVQRGVIDTFLLKNSNGTWVDVSPRMVYPVYPLPAQGYVLLDAERAAA